MGRAFWIALKEVRLFLRDRGDLAFGLLLPVAVFALIYGAFSEQTTFHGTAHIVDEDRGGSYGRLLLERLQQDGTLNIEMHSVSDAERKLARSDIQFVLLIPQDFSRDLGAGKKTALIFKQRGNGGEEGQIVAGMIRSAALQMDQEIQVVQQVESSLAQERKGGAQTATAVQKLLDRERRHPIVEIVETIIGGRPDPAKELFPGIMTMFILFAVTLNARAIVEERRKGTLERLMTTQLTAGQLFAGKFMAGLFRGFVQTLILLTLVGLVFRFLTPLGFLEVMLVTVVFAAAASAIGLLIAVLVRTDAAASWVAVFFTMAMTMLGGTFFSVSRGSALSHFSRISINTYANDAVKNVINRGAVFSDIAGDLIVLATVAIVAFFASRIFFRVSPGGR
jgi:ABC-2 type transport system permease protein